MARRYRQEGFEADDATNQQRVIDVVNALAGQGITNITFTDTDQALGRWMD